ncbi:hypothetical protein EU538_02240 [Candidatus Thorarchaeota archaeon]|nr:MAG: hypothetical protein EU538_02240 [Candidatus Thorarchaeota archaeon]
MAESARFDKEMYLDILQNDLPMKRYVSRGDTPDGVDIRGPHEEADSAIARAIRFTRSDGTPRLQPVLGSAGMGKTHLFWVLREREEEPKFGPYTTIYVPSPPSPVRVPLHFHACIVDEAGDDLFSNAAKMLVSRFGNVSDGGGQDIETIMDHALEEYPGISSDAVKVLLQYQLDPKRKVVARRWLLGDALSQEELDSLDVHTVLEDDDVTLATIKVLSEGAREPLALFIDEMEGPYNTHGEHGERQFLEIMKRLYNESKNIVIVASCLTEIWPRVYDLADAPMKSRMEEPVELRHFTKNDVAGFVVRSMNRYWEEKNVDAPPNPLFPLTEEDIDTAFTKSKGVPREAIRHVINRLDGILLGREQTAVEEQDDYVVKLTPNVVIGAIVKAILIAGIKMDVEVRLRTASGGEKSQSSATVVLERDGTEHRVSIDVPNVKDWNRSGGVAAYYSAKRLQSALDEDEAEIAVIAIPEESHGAKFESISASLGRRLFKLRLNETTAKQLVEMTNRAKLSEARKAVFLDLIGSVFGPSEQT